MSSAPSSLEVRFAPVFDVLEALCDTFVAELTDDEINQLLEAGDLPPHITQQALHSFCKRSASSIGTASRVALQGTLSAADSGYAAGAAAVGDSAAEHYRRNTAAAAGAQ